VIDTHDIKHHATELGFALCGICDAQPTDFAEHFRGWLTDGKHGEMDWLARNVDVRLDPGQLVEGAKSIIVVADVLPPSLGEGLGEGASRDRASKQTSSAAIPPHPNPPPGGEGVTARVARYAHISDYHKVMKKRLLKLADVLREQHLDHTFRVCVDTAPLLEREHAQRAGIGWTGKHTLTLNRDWGSHLMLGAILTTLGLRPDEPETDHCGSCTRCIDACPTDAITPRSVDATRCISYLTIEHRSPIDPKFFEPMGDWIYGCDICQDVCPYVRKAEAAIHHTRTSRGRKPADASSNRAKPPNAQDVTPPHPGPPPKGEGEKADLPPGYERKFASLDVREVLNWTEDDRRVAFQGSAMKRAKLDMIKRNALIVAGNHLRRHADPDLRSRIVRLADADESAMVRQTAGDVLRSLSR